MAVQAFVLPKSGASVMIGLSNSTPSGRGLCLRRPASVCSTASGCSTIVGCSVASGNTAMAGRETGAGCCRAALGLPHRSVWVRLALSLANRLPQPPHGKVLAAGLQCLKSRWSTSCETLRAPEKTTTVPAAAQSAHANTVGVGSGITSVPSASDWMATGPPEFWKAGIAPKVKAAPSFDCLFFVLKSRDLEICQKLFSGRRLALLII